MLNNYSLKLQVTDLHTTNIKPRLKTDKFLVFILSIFRINTKVILVKKAIKKFKFARNYQN
jgi:hypothetical protein